MSREDMELLYEVEEENPSRKLKFGSMVDNTLISYLAERLRRLRREIPSSVSNNYSA
jgi:hypothetical protein